MKSTSNTTLIQWGTALLLAVNAITLIACTTLRPTRSPSNRAARSATGSGANLNRETVFSATTCFRPWQGKLPRAIDAARATSLPVRFGRGRTFSAIRVSKDLLLTAAHCLVGFKGKAKRAPFRIERGGRRIILTVAEMGNYNGTRGRMSDWALFRVENPAVLKGVAVAAFPDRRELNYVLKRRAPSIRQCGLPIWTISYPGPSMRRHPRPPIPGRLRRFLSRGYLQSHRALRELATLAWKHGVLYDQQLAPALPRLPLDVEKVWKANARRFLYRIYEDYRASGDPVIFHSGDFSPGSSGGGVHVEATGSLLGIMPYGTSVGGNPHKGWSGFYMAYRIDRICAESRLLSKLEKCRRLVP